MTADNRAADYQDLHAKQLSAEDPLNRASATTILTLLKDFFDIRSLFDVGCGIGTWLKIAIEVGISDVRGIEGPWLNPTHTVVSPHLIQIADLEKPLALNRRFDLVACLEVAEHLPAPAAETLLDSLTRHADHILFSAAIPTQGGTHHINEQPLTYWVDLFAKRDYLLVDLIRGRIWDNTFILWWLRQNCVLFVQREVLNQNPALLAEHKIKRPVNIISPELFAFRTAALQDEINRAKAFAELLINTGKPALVTRLPNGRLGVQFVS